MKFLHKTQPFFFYSFLKQQNSAIKVVTYRKMPVTEMLWNSDMKLQSRNKDNNTYIFSSKKSKLMLVTMATPISSHVKDKNSIFTARDEGMIF